MGTTEVTLNPERIDWNSDSNHLLLNPRWSRGDQENLFEVAQTLTRQWALKSHVWLATSGSTSESKDFIKLVALSKNAFVSSAKSVNSHLQCSSRDVWLQVLPRFHVGGLGVEVRAGLTGSKVLSDFERWDAIRTHSLIHTQKITIVSLVPTQVFDLVQAKLTAPTSLRAVIVGGGAMNESLYLSARKLGWPLLPSYGMTETCSQIATASLESLSSVKMPLPQKLSHAEWQLNSEGLLQVQGPSLLTGYGQRQKNLEILGWDPKESGWFTTEDFVQLSNDEVRFMGRKSDFLKIGGEATSMGRLREIFERLLADENPSFATQVLIVDAPSERLGAEIHLVASTDPQNQSERNSLSRLQDKFNQQVLPFERIREVKYIKNIPRSDLGKVLGAQLKKELYGY